MERFKNYKRITFSKPVYEATNVGLNEFDISMPNDDELEESVFQEIYLNQIIEKLVNTPTIKREEFIDYQIEKYGADAKQWLTEVSGMINDYHDEINTLGYNVVEDFQKIISSKINIIPTSDLKWSGSETDLLELTVALIEAGAIKNATRKHVISVFSKVFDLSIKDPDIKINRATNRKASSSHKTFTEKLKGGWEDFVKKKTA